MDALFNFSDCHALVQVDDIVMKSGSRKFIDEDFFPSPQREVDFLRKSEKEKLTRPASKEADDHDDGDDWGLFGHPARRPQNAFCLFCLVLFLVWLAAGAVVSYSLAQNKSDLQNSMIWLAASFLMIPAGYTGIWWYLHISDLNPKAQNSSDLL